MLQNNILNFLQLLNLFKYVLRFYNFNFHSSTFTYSENVEEIQRKLVELEIVIPSIEFEDNNRQSMAVPPEDDLVERP